MEDYPSQADAGTDMLAEMRSSQIGQKTSCWQCYKMFLEEKAQKIDERRVFCSKDCLHAFKSANNVTNIAKIRCSNTNCSNNFFKESGILSRGSWYCSEKCVPGVGEKYTEQKTKFFNTQQKEHKTKSVPSKNRGGSYDKHNESSSSEADKLVDVDLDFSDITSPVKPLLTLEELEQKYKQLNQTSRK